MEDKGHSSEDDGHLENDPLIDANLKVEYESCNHETDTNRSICDENQVVEIIEDHRHSLPSNSSLRCRVIGPSSGSTSSLPALLSRDAPDISFRGSMLSLKQSVESKIVQGGKLCRDCLQKSIESHISSLGLGSMSLPNSNKFHDDSSELDIDELVSAPASVEAGKVAVTARVADSPNDQESEDDGDMKSHRRTLSEIDWHAITQFAQGDVIDPASRTAKELMSVIAGGSGVHADGTAGGGCSEFSLAFQLMQRVDFEHVAAEAERCVQCVINRTWRNVSHWELPHWLRDNDFLWHMHRPQLSSFKDCFGSMFRVHTETGNIWTHFFGMIMVIAAMIVVYTRGATHDATYPRGWQEYTVFSAFFIGAFCCLMFSWLFHTCCCHSEKTTKLFSKLDYTGISFMIVGSFTPMIYYGFYCRYIEKVVYMTIISLFGLSCIIVSLWDKFATPRYRPLRAGLFLCLGCSAFIPCIHIVAVDGFHVGVAQASLGWCLLMGVMYISGALLYAARIPERFLPGRCNIWIQSHQIWHVIVVVAAFIHLHGICQSAIYRSDKGRFCPSLDPTPFTHAIIGGVKNATKNFLSNAY